VLIFSILTVSVCVRTSVSVYVIIVADVIGALTITGSNVASTVKAEPQVVNAKNGPMHPTDRSRPASKWCRCYVSTC